ncbi:hypothetical protein NQZ79_g8174 [Umbelopsis isabellina]|nr:hypothetical protein NQZ79_g8174 [Umbelopsis isabellina]
MILSTISASQFESTKSVLLDRVEKYRTLLMNNEILPLSKQSKASYITGAIVLYLSIKVYSIFAYPSNLRHIKRMPVFTWLSSLIKGETAIQRTQRLLIPIWEEGNGMIAIYDQSGWTINVSNPEAVKTILYKTGTDILIHLPFHIAGAMTDQITDLYPKSGSTQRAKDGTLLRGFFGKMNLVLANGHEWMKRRKESMPKGINFGYVDTNLSL